MKIIDLSGKKFDFLTVIELSSRDKLKGKTYWRCICDCGTERVVASSVLNSKSSIARCDNCKAFADKKLRWKGYEEISGDFYRSISDGAASRGFDFLVSIEDLWSLFLKQDKKCALSGQFLILSKGRRHEVGTASLDRIDSKVGYIPENVQWVHKDVNFLKNKYPEEYLLKICKMVSDKFSGVKND
jgi:hypothetical protein